MSKPMYSVLYKWPRWISFVLATMLFSAILISANTGTALLDDNDVTFSKVFVPNTIGPGSTATLLFTITNVSGNPVTTLAFTDTLPISTTIASSATTVTTCSDGVLDTPDGDTTITFSGGRLPPFGSCAVTVDVVGSNTPGVYTNTSGNLTSSAGNHGPTTANLTVNGNRPGFSKSFAPSSVPLGSRSTLTFFIDNTANTSLMYNLTFIDNLPPGMVVADPPNVSDTCASTAQPAFAGGVVTAVPGTSVVSLSPGPSSYAAVDAGSTCTITVDVVATGVGPLGNVSGELVSSSYPTPGTYSSGKASATLEVTRDDLSLIKSFTDDPVPAGGPATLEFTITNFDRFDSATDITFTDDLTTTLSGLAATGLPANDVCGSGSQLIGTDVLTLTGGTLPPEGSCSFSVALQVPISAAAGVYTNTTSSITADVGGSGVTGGPASDKLFIEGAAPPPVLTKTFTDDPVAPGDTVTLEFTITNVDATRSVTDVAFTDNLNDALPGLTATGLPLNDVCGTGSQIAGTNLLTFTGGDLAGGASCTFSVTLQVPVGVPAGSYTNTTSDVTGTIDGVGVTGNPAVDDLVVIGAPVLSKSFIDPVAPGDTVDLWFTLFYAEGAPADATAIAFTDDLSATLSGLTAIGLPANDVCGAGSQISGTTNLSFTGGTLAPGALCIFSVTLQVPAGASPGSYVNTTSNITATVSGLAVTGNQAQDALDIAGLILTKSFTDDPAIPGDTVTLEFSLVNASTVHTATSITFDDDLGNVLAGLLPTDLPKNDICGPGSSLALVLGDTLRFQNGTLAPGASCAFTATLQVPAGAASDMYGNATSGFQATIDGSTVQLTNASDVLIVSDEWLWLTKDFTDDPVAPGETVTLEFTIENLHATQSVTDVAFTDDLTATLSGLAATGLPVNDVCGTGSQISGTNDLTLTGGNLPASGSCTFQVTLQVPLGVAFGSYTNQTSDIAGSIGGFAVKGAAAADDLDIADLAFSKAFSGPTVTGGTVDLGFTIENLGTSSTVSDISFSDDLDAVISGLAATSLPPDGFCGGGSRLTGTLVLSMSNGVLGPSESCTFSVTLQVPASAVPGDYINTTSDLLSAGSSVGEPATDTLMIEPPPTFDKSFAPNPIAAGFTSTLIFSIDNTASSLAASGLDFTDNLPAGVVVATPPNGSTTCTGGTLTAVAGTGAISYTGGTVAAGATCTVQVDVTSASVGAHVNISGDLTSSSGNSGPATDTLTVNPQPGFDKSFAPDPIAAGFTSTLSFAIDNTGSTAAASGLDFTDNPPAGVVVATPPNASTTCSGGTLTAAAGTGTIAYTGGTAAAGATCTVQADVASNTAGDYVNVSGDLTSSLGNSGPATDTLRVNPQPGFDKAFAPDPIAAGFASPLSFAIDNTGSTVDATNLGFTDNLPAGLVVATPPNASTTCSGGALTAVAGTGVIAYTGGTAAAGVTCTVQADVTSNTAGDYVNVSGDLTSSLGNSGTATDTLTIEYMDFGDAVDPTYPTLFASSGASHELGTGVYLGSCVDAEPNGQPSAGADGDDVDVGAPVYGTCRRVSDEDGVIFMTPLYSDAQGQIRVIANAACTLSGWIDFSADGDWADTGETLFPGGQALVAGPNDLTFMIPVGAQVGDTYARFRCTTDGAVSYTGRASDGEVEDYQVTILPSIRDLGDAPDPDYPTLLASTGASHKLGSGVYLGICVDAELNGQPTLGADGDDVNVGSPVFGTCVGDDDEDGVMFTSALLADETTDIEVTASTTCTLSAWIDFDANGDWSDAGENLFPGGQMLVPGSNILGIAVPAGAATGDTYARFRCTTDGAVGFTGEASDGEVEDYRVRIGAALDLGDVPDPTYPTLLASAGASHVVGSDVYLGHCVDAEVDGQPTPGADGDDANASSPVFGTCQEGGDEDGVVFTSLLVAGETASIQVTTNAVCTLSAWIDFNADGDWSDAGEGLFPGGQALVAGTNNLAFAVPTGAEIGDTYARFRCTTDGAVGFTGEASDGEVEDYQVKVGALDFGDAPDPDYPTLLAGAGASHVVGSDVYLGSCVDAEADGQPAFDADGDDLSVGSSVVGTCVGDDDEDGVNFTGILVGGQTANVEVTANSTCTLSAWIDFDANGDWSGTGEDLFPGGQVLVPGVNALSFAVPAGAARGVTYARFRCTTDGAVGFTGEASDGEVEDHRVRVGAALDLGDALDPDYPTLLGSLGASHMLGSDVYLGSCVDAELDGQPTPGADGDDANTSSPVFGTCQEGDDEDGVTFLDLLVGGETADIEVTANAACTLSGWIDFNADGDWADAGEDLFPGGVLLAPGVNPLSFAVPTGAVIGDTYARFRCTTDGAAAFTGPASDGEVEDYQVTVWGFAYLPLVMNDYVVAPDLVVENIIATSEAITVVIKNVGNALATDEFWVDVYIDPSPAPTVVNQIWPDLSDEGAAWAITVAALPLAPGDVLTLTTGDAHYVPEYSDIDWPLAAGTQVYAQVDSWDGSTTYGAVEEAHEIMGVAYNNVSGPVLVVADAVSLPSPAVGPVLGALPSASDSLRYQWRRYQWK